MDLLISETHTVFQEKETEQSWTLFNAQLRKWEQHVTEAISAAARHVTTNLAGHVTCLPAGHPLRGRLVSSLGHYGGIAPHIQACLTSERTILSATACDLVTTVAGALTGEFDSLVDVFCPTLLRLCQRSNKVFVRRAEEALLAVIDLSKSAKIIPLLCDNLSKSNKNRQAKAVATKALVKVLQVDVVAGLETCAEAMTVAMAEGVVDSAPEVRDSAKEMYSLFKKKFPAQALILFSSVDLRTQKILEGETVVKVPKDQVPKPWLANLSGPRKALGSLDENLTSTFTFSAFPGSNSAAATQNNSSVTTTTTTMGAAFEVSAADPPARALASKPHRAVDIFGKGQGAAAATLPPPPPPLSPSKMGRTLGTTKSQRILASLPPPLKTGPTAALSLPPPLLSSSSLLSSFGDFSASGLTPVLPTPESTPRPILSKPQRTLLPVDAEAQEAPARALDSKPKRAPLAGPARVVGQGDAVEKEKPLSALPADLTLKRGAPSSPLPKEDKKQRVALQKAHLVSSKSAPVVLPSASNVTAPTLQSETLGGEPPRQVKVPARKKKPSEVQPQEKAREESTEQTLTPSQLSLDEIFGLTAEQEWSAKVTGFENLRRKLETTHNEVGAKQTKVLDLLVEAMGEKHFRVLQAVLDCMLSFSKHFPEALKPANTLQKVITSLLNILTEPALQAKKSILAAAENVNRFLIDVYGGEELLLLLVRMVPDQAKHQKRFFIILDMLSSGIKKQQSLIDAARSAEPLSSQEDLPASVSQRQPQPLTPFENMVAE